MGYQLIDSENLLSKNQKLKIKTILQKYDEHDNLENFIKNNILPNIYYEDETKKYNHFEIEKQNDELYVIKFLILSNKNNDKKKNLKQRLHMQKLIRQNSSDPKVKMWKQYYDISKRVKMALPNPDMIQAQQSQYTELIDKMPNSIIKKYFISCLS